MSYMKPELIRLFWGVKSPWSAAAFSIVLLLEWLFFGMFQPSLAMGSAAMGLGAASLALWMNWMLRSPDFARRRYQITQEAQAGRLPRLEQLHADLQQVGCPQGVAQLGQLRRKFDSMTSVLMLRLDAGELTYSRYLDTAEQVYLSAIDNLHDIAISLRSVSTIDRQVLDGRLADLRGDARAGPASQREIETLEQRRLMLDHQVSKVTDLLVQNETAMTALDHAATALANARMGKGHASVELDQALQDLDQLARRATKYAAVSRN
jgi:hypothetical protein